MRYAIVLLLGLLLQSSTAHAQKTTKLIPDGTAVGGTVGALVVEGTSLLTGSLHVYNLKAHRAGVTFDVTIPTQPLKYGLLLFPDLGVAYNASAPGATFLFKAGGSAVIGGDDGLYPGVHLGLAVVTATGAGSGLVIDATEHWYWSGGSAVRTLTVGIGFAALPRVGH